LIETDAPEQPITRQPLSVLHVITGLGDGGAEACLYRLATHDVIDRHEVVALMDADKYGPLLEQAGIRVHALGMPRSRVTRSGLRRLWSIVRTSDADVIQTWMYHGDLIGGGLARMAGRRAIVWGIHNTFMDPLRTRVIARAAAMASWGVPRTIISCSEAASRLHARMGYDASRLVVVPNGYDLSRFEPDPVARASLRAEWGAGPTGVVLGTVARWDPQKDHANLARALSQLDPVVAGRCRLVLVGTGMDGSNQALVQLLDTHGLRERTLLLGRRDDVAGVMSAFDLHVLPSVAEAFPNVIAEAMACGTPCVVTDTGDSALIVGDTGWVVPARDSAALARALERAIASVDDAVPFQDRKAAARARIEDNFSLARMAESYAEVWEAAARGRIP
jgi:glycosyltransferase involved in cell wall biosynthesis